MTGIELGVAVIVGVSAVLHRVTGVGFALIAFPALIVLYGPAEGLAIGFVLALAVSILVLIQSWRDVMLRRALQLSLPALVTVPVGAWLVHRVSPAALTLAIGSYLLLTLLAARPGSSLPLSGGGSTLVTGAAAGFAHVTSGISVPVLASYAISTGWKQESFAASAQVIFIFYNAGSLAALGATTETLLSATRLLPVVLVSSFLGIYVQRRCSSEVAQKAVVVVAAASAVAAIVRGLYGLVA